MSQRPAPYWNGNVAHIRFSRGLSTVGPDDSAVRYGQTLVRKPLAEVVPLALRSWNKDASRPE
jgi:hypothetical protein